MSAVISLCGHYRYRLDRDGPGEGATAVIMVNPSTADADQDDATIRKLLGFGERYDWGRILVGNLFAFRATDVRNLVGALDPVGPANDLHLVDILLAADRLIVAWGPLSKQPKYHRHRWRQVMVAAAMAGLKPLSLGPPAQCGHPRHPLMLGYDQAPQPWVAPR